jgi:hypothetical protein
MDEVKRCKRCTYIYTNMCIYAYKNNMTASSQQREQLSDEYPYETYHKNDWKILGRRIWKFDMSMCVDDMEKVQAISLHDECLVVFNYA